MRRFVLWTASLFFFATGAMGMDWYRPNQSLRALNTDLYDISIQKNGAVDVALSAGLPVFSDARPWVWLDDEPAPKPLPLSGRLSSRVEVKDPLGEGNGMTFARGACEWLIRVYPSKPFVTVRAAYVNTGKKSVRVRALIPWAVGADKRSGLSLGGDLSQARILGCGGASWTNAVMPPLTTGADESPWMLAAFQQATGRSLIAGFLSANKAETRVSLDPPANPNALGALRAICVYDPPVEVPPGGRLESEDLYLAAAETDVLEGLERYAHAAAVWNGIGADMDAPPHGWDATASEYGPAIAEAQLLTEAETLSRNLRTAGWKQVVLGPGWQKAEGDGEPDPTRFPSGLRSLTNKLHELGLTAGIALNPFVIAPDSNLAKTHPDWLADPLPESAPRLGEGVRILDVTAPGAADHVRALCQKAMVDWNFDALAHAGEIYSCMLAARYRDPALTRIEVARIAFQAVRDGIGPKKWAGGLAPQPLTITLARGLRPFPPCVPAWRGAETGWGCLETVESAARRYYYAPFFGATDDDVFFGAPQPQSRWTTTALTDEQTLAWFSAMTLTRGALRFGDAPSRLNEAQRATLARLLPVPDRPARPLDLFTNNPPRIWTLPTYSPAGAWLTAALFNWEGTGPEKIHLDFRAAGLDPQRYYAVYDFWAQKYLGAARGGLDVEVQPGCVKVYGFRPREDHPMLLAMDRPLTQGAESYSALNWDPEIRALTGTFTAKTGGEYVMTILCPKSWTPVSVKLDRGTPTVSFTAPLLTVRFAATPGDVISWSIAF